MMGEVALIPYYTGGRMIKNIIWDFDGTLFDTYPPIARAVQRGLHQLGFEYSVEELLTLCKISMTHCMQTLADQTSLPFAEIEEAFDQQYVSIPLEEQQPYPGVKDVLQKVTELGGKNIIITHRGSGTLQKLLASYQLESYFSGCITADDGFPRKPNPAAFFAALQSYHLNPAETLGIGDRGLDIEAARGAGLKTAFYGLPPQGLQVDLVIDEYFLLLDQLSNF
jgi:HAD superfamily hydrolase (TIGR01549 family)